MKDRRAYREEHSESCFPFSNEDMDMGWEDIKEIGIFEDMCNQGRNDHDKPTDNIQ